MRTRPPSLLALPAAAATFLLAVTTTTATPTTSSSSWLEPSWTSSRLRRPPGASPTHPPAASSSSPPPSLFPTHPTTSSSLFALLSATEAPHLFLDHGSAPPPPPPPLEPVWWFGGEGKKGPTDTQPPSSPSSSKLSKPKRPSSGLAPRVYLFTKYPVPGKAKTRMIPALGREGAARFHRRLVRQTLQTMDTFRKGSGVDCRVRYDDSLAGEDGAGQMKAWLGLDWIYEPQGPGDLGERMAAATALADGGEKDVGSVVLIGSDCPFITPGHLQEAVAALDEEGNDVVVGPAKDGGYWLIGLRRPCPELFQGVDWGSGRVLEQTLAIAQGLGLQVKCLEALHDMDRPSDLSLWTPPPLTSIIIPVLNEAPNLAATLAAVYNGTSTHYHTRTTAAAAAAAGKKKTKRGRGGGGGGGGAVRDGRGLKIHDPNVEVIVVDGGSTDGSQRLALALGARVVTSPIANRAAQMNLGAAAATGDVLLFLHGDTLLPATWEDEVRGAFSKDPKILATAFRLRIQARAPLYRVLVRPVIYGG